VDDGSSDVYVLLVRVVVPPKAMMVVVALSLLMLVVVKRGIVFVSRVVVMDVAFMQFFLMNLDWYFDLLFYLISVMLFPKRGEL